MIWDGKRVGTESGSGPILTMGDLFLGSRDATYGAKLVPPGWCDVNLRLTSWASPAVPRESLPHLRRKSKMKSKIMKMIKSPIKSKSKTHRSLRRARIAEGNSETFGLGVGLSGDRTAANSDSRKFRSQGQS
jgi:hypothetical protein